MRYWFKGDNTALDGIHPKAFVAVRQYREVAGIAAGPLFRPQANRGSEKLANRRMHKNTMARLIQSYLNRVPGGMVPRQNAHGEEVLFSYFTPHSLRATTATLLDQRDVPRVRIQELLKHAKPETTDGYCQNEWAPRDSASHAMPL